MGLVALAQGFLLAAVMAGPGDAAPTGREALPAPIATRQTAFLIPFRIDRNDPRSANLQAVACYVSKDRGASWLPQGRVSPRQQSFYFRAEGDGEYWFSLCTVDRSGKEYPEGPKRPGLRVVVDTTPPRLQLEARRGNAGQIEVRWQLTDLNLKADSLTIQYRTSPTESWQPVAIDKQEVHASGFLATGGVAWVVPPGTERVEIRAEAADYAGNSAVSQAQVNSDRVATAPPRPVPNDNPYAGAPYAGAGPALNPASSSPSSWSAARPAGPLLQAPAIGGAPSANPNTSQASPGRPALFQSPNGTIAIQINPPIGNQYGGPNDRDSRGAGNMPLDGLPPGARIRMVNAARFELEYDLESVGPSGVGRVELWGTRDGGRTWTSYGVDEDKRSPILVSVKDEGIYGFHVAVRSGAGLGGEPPKSGDLPDVWIGVDLTKPWGRIVSAEQQGGDKAGQLLIRWEAGDWRLAARPITLSYAESRDGPWNTIAASLENSGQHLWAFDRRVPERIYLRLEVRDEAGNVGIFEPAQPIILDQRRPQIRIRDIRPVEGRG